MKREQGFVTSIAVVVALAILVFFSGIYYMLQTSARENIVIDYRDKSAAVAEAAVQEVINKVRANPNLSELEKQMVDKDNNLVMPEFPYRDGLPTPSPDGFYDVYHRDYPRNLKNIDGDVSGQYFSKVKEMDLDSADWAGKDIFRDEQKNVVSGKIFHIVTEGWSIDRREKNRSHAITHSYVHLANVGEYFCAVRGHLNITSGAQLGEAKVYGRSLEFKFDTTPPHDTITRLKKAEYEVSYDPDIWPVAGDLGFGTVLIQCDKNNNCSTDSTVQANTLPSPIKSPLVFPSLNEQLVFYKNTIRTAPTNNSRDRCRFTSGPILPPSVDNNYIGEDGLGHKNEFTNKEHAYYCGEGNDVTIGNVEVRGQVIIAAEQKVWITGDIFIDNGAAPAVPHSQSQNNYTPPDPNPPLPQGLPSTADQLVIYAKQGVFIRGDWCSASGPELRLQGILVISPDGSIKYDPEAILPIPTVPCTDFATYSLDFLGAMFLAAQPGLSKDFFGVGRNYRYLQTLKTDPPPIREFYQVLKQFTLRRGTADPNATPAP